VVWSRRSQAPRRRRRRPGPTVPFRFRKDRPTRRRRAPGSRPGTRRWAVRGGRNSSANEVGSTSILAAAGHVGTCSSSTDPPKSARQAWMSALPLSSPVLFDHLLWLSSSPNPPSQTTRTFSSVSGAASSNEATSVAGPPVTMMVSGARRASSTRNSRPALGTGSSRLSIGRSAPGMQGTSLPHRATTRSASSWYMSREPIPWAVVLCTEQRPAPPASPREPRGRGRWQTDRLPRWPCRNRGLRVLWGPSAPLVSAVWVWACPYCRLAM
jgi:hypothetical protein